MVFKIIASLGVIIILGLVGIWMEYRHVLSKPVVLEKAIVFEVKKGDSFDLIIANLIKKEVAIKPFWCKIIVRKNKISRQLKVGEYLIKIGTTTPQLLHLLATGKTRQYKVTFLEGWIFKDIIKAIAQHPKITQNIIDLPAQEIMAYLNVTHQHPEGLFFPDTYYFEKGDSDKSILQRSYTKMQQVLAIQWQKREEGLPLDSAYKALILASIIEKETSMAEEREAIAGVFIRRLRKGMLLQADPTVIYGMGDRYQGNISKRNLLEPTLYNTYVIKGLPPTPIAMPGKEAIYAAVHPKKGTSLFFVAQGDGSHIFSTTLNAHNQAVNTFQRKRK